MFDPLARIRVLDLSRILSGPFATMTLADLGADVIKVEDVRTGDDTRQWAPPYWGDESAYFLAVNRSKRSLAVDLKDPEGNAAVRQLAAQADVVVENFRPGVAARLGLDFESVRAQNAGVVYASISGFGQTGPDRDGPGYDAIAQALSGIMSVTGEATGDPVRVGVSSADLAAGTWAIIGILAALHARATTGVGQHVDVSLLDAQVSWLTYVATGWLASGEVPRRHGSAHPTIVPYQSFPTADGHVMVAVGNDRLWRQFAPAIGRPELAEDPRYVTNPDRVVNRVELLALLRDVFASASTESWTARLHAAGVPSAPINDVGAALEHPQVQARGMVWSMDHPTVGPIQAVGCPLVGNEGRPTPPPRHGEHSTEVLLELGLSAEQIEKMRARNVIR